MWRNKLRLLVILAVGLVVVLLGLSFKSVNITDRAFVLGLGIDFADDKYELACEILVPSGSAGGGSADGSHQVLTGEGDDIANALNDIFARTGKLPSLGHCSVIVLGEGVYKRDVLDELDFFIKSDSFRASVVVAVTEGQAKELLQTTTPLQKFTSLSLFEITSVYGKNTDSPVTTLGEFRSKMLSDSESAYLTNIKTIEAKAAEGGGGSEAGGGGEETGGGDSGGGEEKPVFYDCSTVAVFRRDGGFSGFLSRSETDGINLLEKKSNFASFSVKDDGGKPVMVSLSSKKVSVRAELDANTAKVVYKIDVKLRLAEAEDLNTVEGFLVATEITEKMRQDVKRQMEEKINAALDKSRETKSDFLFLANKLFAKKGKKWQQFKAANPDYLGKVDVEVVVKIGG